MNMKGRYFLLIFCLATGGRLFAQVATPPERYQVAIFTPLFLDSAFDQTNTYRYGMNFPKFINPGLEFYEGAQMAIDSLNREGVPLDVFVYDSRSTSADISTTVADPRFDSIDMIIGHVNASEARLLANAAAKKNIPFINATYPNDAGISNNPNYIILNSTLYTHFNAMYKFIQKNYALAPIVYFRKKGAAEDRLKSYFDEIAANTSSVPLKIKFVTLDEEFSPDDVEQHLDNDRTTVCIAGSLAAGFGEQLTSILSAVHEEKPAILFAMPTWWDVTDFTKPEFRKVEVIFTTPFYVQPTHPLGIRIENNFKARFYSRPTDMVFRGYETLYHFAHLLGLNGKNTGSALSDKRFRVFSEFDIQPVLDPKTTTLDYFENKKIYFIKKVDGIVTAVY